MSLMGACLAIVALNACCQLAEQVEPGRNQGRRERPVVSVEQLRFGDGVLRERWLAFDAAARSMADASWLYDPYRRSHSTLSAKWCSNGAERGKYCAGERSGTLRTPGHFIRLEVNTKSQDSHEVTSFRVYTHTCRDEAGWRVQTFYTAPKGGLMLAMYKCHVKDAVSEVDPIYVPAFKFRSARGFNGIQYVVNIPGVDEPQQAHRISDRDTLAMLRSAEAFRDHTLLELDALSALVRARISSGEGLTAFDWRNTKGEPPQIEVTRFLTPDQKQQILDASIAELERRRKLVHSDYAELYEVFRTSLDWDKCLMK